MFLDLICFRVIPLRVPTTLPDGSLHHQCCFGDFVRVPESHTMTFWPLLINMTNDTTWRNETAWRVLQKWSLAPLAVFVPCGLPCYFPEVPSFIKWTSQSCATFRIVTHLECMLLKFQWLDWDVCINRRLNRNGTSKMTDASAVNRSLLPFPSFRMWPDSQN